MSVRRFFNLPTRPSCGIKLYLYEYVDCISVDYRYIPRLPYNQSDLILILPLLLEPRHWYLACLLFGKYFDPHLDYTLRLLFILVDQLAELYRYRFLSYLVH
jgi:hypothetical protein